MAYFNFTDGWLLTVLWAGKEAIGIDRLQDLADAFNHARFTDAELARSTQTLAAAGLAHPTDGVTYQITEAGRAFVNAQWRPQEGHIRNMFLVADALKASS